MHRWGVTRLWNFSQRVRGNSNGATAAPPPPPPPALVDPSLGEASEHYLSRPVRPVAQLGARVGLWSAVVLGCLGGLVGLAGPSDDVAPRVAGRSADDSFVPAPVAGMAETAVEAWLAPAMLRDPQVAEADGESEGETNEDVLGDLFIERPSTSQIDAERLSVRDVLTVAGRRLDEGYWTVTVAAEVVETIDDVAQPASTWYVEVGIVGDPEGGLAALTTPAVVPAPPGVVTNLRPSSPLPGPPEDGDPVAATVEGFLDALLAGDGDPARYLAPRVTMEAASPAPFVDLELLEMAVEEVNERGQEGDIRVWATVRATTAGESSQMLAYELVVIERVDRWEILELSGARTVEVSEEEQQLPSAEEPEDEDTTTTVAGETSEDGTVEGEQGSTDGSTGETGDEAADGDVSDQTTIPSSTGRGEGDPGGVIGPAEAPWEEPTPTSAP